MANAARESLGYEVNDESLRSSQWCHNMERALCSLSGTPGIARCTASIPVHPTLHSPIELRAKKELCSPSSSVPTRTTALDILVKLEMGK